MSAASLPPIEFLRECFAYEPKSGSLTWRRRPEAHFADSMRCAQWNTRYAGTGGVIDALGYQVFRLTFQSVVYRLTGHRIIFALENSRWPLAELDHRDNDTRNNRLYNLRETGRKGNAANRRGWAKTGLPKGVTMVGSRFRASANNGPKRTVHLGTFDTPAEAHAAFVVFASQRHGEFFNPGETRPSIFD